MPRLLILLLFLLMGMQASGQNLFDGFEDGDLLRNPTWQGNTDQYINTLGGELQLESPAAGRSYISTPCLLRDTARWHIYLRLNLNPSAQNQALYVLSSDIADLNGPWSGWALRVGYNGVNDGLDLLQFQNGSPQPHFKTFFQGKMARYPEVAVSIVRTRAGNWQVVADTNTSGQYAWAGDTTIAAPLNGSFVGVLCHYTISNLTNFYFDRLEAGPIFPDSTPPKLVRRKVYRNRIRLDFDEALDRPATSDFMLEPGARQPDSLKQIGKSVWLYFTPSLEPGLVYRLVVARARDVSGNDTSFNIPIKYLLPAGPGMLVLSEVKPSSRRLITASPAAEFVEVKNLSSYTLALDSVMLYDRSRAHATLPEDSLEPGGYAVLCRSADTGMFARSVHLVKCTLPALNDDGDSLKLLSRDGELLDVMTYTPDNYDELADVYTHSLECRLDQRDCLPTSLLWVESASDTGSTAGVPNSTEGLSALEGLAVLGWDAPDGHSLAVRLNQNAEAGSAFRATITCQGDAGFAAGDIIAESSLANRSKLTLTWNGNALSSGKTYHLEMTGLQGCRTGQETVSLDFGLPLLADSGRLCLNEIMFEPATGGAEWVELINPSSTDWLSLEGASMGNWPATAPDSLALSGLFSPLAPGGIVWISKSKRQARNAHPQAPMGNFRQANVPELYSLEGDISLRAASGRLIESVQYSRKLHHPLLAQTRGVSLERTSPGIPANADGAFVSAARSAGFSTPGMPNSASVAGGGDVQEAFSASPPAFSPDLDGRNDYCSLSLSLPGSQGEAWFYTIRIFDGEGRLIRTLADNLSGTGRVEHLWDGTSQGRARAVSGPYIALAEYFTLSGRKGHAKCGLAVAPW